MPKLTTVTLFDKAISLVKDYNFPVTKAAVEKSPSFVFESFSVSSLFTMRFAKHEKN